MIRLNDLAKSIVTLLVAIPFQGSFAANTRHDRSDSIVLAQSSMGVPDPGTQSPPGASAPRLDYVRPYVAPVRPDPTPSPEPQRDIFWGAIGFTADGSYATAWKKASQPEAEALVAKACAAYGRGACKVVSFSRQECVALATFIGNYKRRKWALSFTAGGTTYPEAQGAAITSCNSDERSRGRCQPRIAACADGR
jgi:hypothetical protein